MSVVRIGQKIGRRGAALLYGWPKSASITMAKWTLRTARSMPSLIWCEPLLLLTLVLLPRCMGRTRVASDTESATELGRVIALDELEPPVQCGHGTLLLTRIETRSSALRTDCQLGA